MSIRHMCALWQKESTADILTPHERVITQVCWNQWRLVGDVPFHLKFALKLTHPFEERRLRPISAYNVWTVKASKRCSIIANRKSTTRFPMSYRWSAYVTPHSPNGWLKKRIYFLWIKFTFSQIKSATKFLYVKTSSSLYCFSRKSWQKVLNYNL